MKCMGFFLNNYNMEKTSKCVSVPMGIIFPSQCTLNNRMQTLFNCTVLYHSLCRLVCHNVAGCECEKMAGKVLNLIKKTLALTGQYHQSNVY